MSQLVLRMGDEAQAQESALAGLLTEPSLQPGSQSLETMFLVS